MIHQPFRSENTSPKPDAVFGFLLLGGTLNGAQIHDIRLANELHRRGFRVCVWWVVDRPSASPLNPGIEERFLFHSFRYASGRISPLLDQLGKLSCWLLTDKVRSAISQRIPWCVSGTLRGLIKAVCQGIESDVKLVRRLAQELTSSQVTHLIGTIEILGLFAKAARDQVSQPMKYLVQFQGYETYAPYAAKLGLEEKMYERIREAVDASDFHAVSVSTPYNERINAEVGVPMTMLRVIPPGVPITRSMDQGDAITMVSQNFTDFDATIPLVSYLGRRDSEKGIDLLIYATRILRERGHVFQLAICGPTAFGSRYAIACRQIAQVLQVPVLSSDYVSNELRTALFRASTCLVYPSIHAEPFGMVPVEAMVQGVPVIVPDTGGVAELPFHGKKQGGLTFQSWDSGDLARQIERLLTDAQLHSRLSASAPSIAAQYSVELFTDRTLNHMGIPTQTQLKTVMSDSYQQPDQRAA
ncbi:MAG: glycosyltransferase family 4 protein [Planctomycetaceae bacterium]